MLNLKSNSRTWFRCLLFSFLMSSSLTAQTKDKLIKKITWPAEPVKIINLKAGGKDVKFDEAFNGEDNWFKGITLTVENTSGKPISSLLFSLGFPRPKDGGLANEPPYSVSLAYGLSTFYPKERLAAPLQPLPVIEPGGRKEITLSDNGYFAIKHSLQKLKYAETINLLEIKLDEVGFADETAWASGQIWRRQVLAPRGWMAAEN